MAIVATIEGTLAIWKQILSIAPGIGIPILHLYGAAHTPVHADTLPVYAGIELVVGGYAPVSLSAPAVNWTFAVLPSGETATYIVITWTFTGPCTVWGYYLDDQSESWSLWAEQIGPFIYGAGGGTFSLQLMPWLASQPSLNTGIPCLTP